MPIIRVQNWFQHIHSVNRAFNINWRCSRTVICKIVMLRCRKIFAVTENKKKTPKNIRLNFPSDLKNPYLSADVVVITPRKFTDVEGTLQLKSLWESEGHTVQIVDVQDIYDEFNFGITGSEPIRDFIRYAYNNWSSPQINQVILLGEGVDDTRDNSYSRMYNLIPVKKTWTYNHGATASDQWYGCIVGTIIFPMYPLPELAFGRKNKFWLMPLRQFPIGKIYKPLVYGVVI